MPKLTLSTPPQPGVAGVVVPQVIVILRPAVADVDATLKELGGRDHVVSENLSSAAKPSEHVEHLAMPT